MTYDSKLQIKFGYKNLKPIKIPIEIIKVNKSKYNISI